MGDATRVKVERSAKRVRAYLGGEIIVEFDPLEARLGSAAIPRLLLPDGRRSYASPRRERS